MVGGFFTAREQQWLLRRPGACGRCSMAEDAIAQRFDLVFSGSVLLHDLELLFEQGQFAGVIFELAGLVFEIEPPLLGGIAIAMVLIALVAKHDVLAPAF